MRGPLESLIAQARQEQIRKALPPSLFAKAEAHSPQCTLRAIGLGRKLAFKGLPSCYKQKIFEAGSAIRSPIARIKQLSEKIALYLFGYRNKITSGMNFGRNCDKKGSTEEHCVRDSSCFPGP